MHIPINQALTEARHLARFCRERYEFRRGSVDPEIDALCDAIDRLAAVADVLAAGLRNWPVDVPPSAWISLSSGPEVKP